MKLCAALVLGLAFYDGHVHLNQLAPVLEQMQRHQVERSIIFWGHATDNAQVEAAARQHPGRLVPFLSVSPEREEPYGRWWRTGDRGLLTYAEHELARGVYRGIGELSIVHFPSRGFPETEISPQHPLLDGLMGLAARFKVPVLIHCEMTYARELAQLLARHPNVPVIWAHGGYAPLYWVERMLDEHPNLTIDLSMRTVEDHPRSPDYWICKAPGQIWPQWLELIEANPSRFVVGSDAAQRDAQADEARLLASKLVLDQLTPGTRAAVGTTNLERLTGYSTAPALPRKRKTKKKATRRQSSPTR